MGDAMADLILQQIPPAVWTLAGGVLGVMGTLAASMVANRGNNTRLEKQLKQDESQKHLDRITQARRSVYLEAVDEMVGISVFLGSLGGADPTDQEALSSAFVRFQKACGRISLVCEEETRKRLVDLAGGYSRLFIELMVEAKRAHSLKVDIGVNRDAYETLSAERQRIVSAIKEASESVAPKYIVEALSASFDRVTKQIEKNASEYDAFTKAYNAELPIYARAAAEKISEISPLQAEISAGLRRELGLDVDLEEMRRQFVEQAALAKSAGEKFFSDFGKK